MNLKIGKKEFAVDRIIYVSPNGNDNNDGLSKSAPLLTLTHAIEYIINLGGGAICFMRGVHDFTDQCFYQSDNSNNVFIRDFNTKNSFTSGNSVPIIFYSEFPKYTEIHLTKTYLKGYNRTQFINLSNSDSKLINLNIILKCDVATNDGYDSLFTAGKQNLITNCMFNIDVSNWNRIRICSHTGKFIFDNCAFITGSISKQNTYSSVVYNECIFQIEPQGTINNCYINSNLYNMSIDELLENEYINENKIGLGYSDYSEWYKAKTNVISITRTLIENIKTININNNFFNLIFTDNNNLYITDSENNLIKIIHNHDNINVLNKLSVDNNKNLLYNNKKVPFKDILTTEDIKNINANIFGQRV